MSEAEWQCRVELAAAYRLMDHFGVRDLTYNHLSARIPGEPDALLIKPGDFMFGEVTASSLLKYDLNGNFMYSWGTWGDFPGGMWGVHGMSVDPEGNFYVTEVDNGGVQKYRPRKGANPAFLVGRPIRSAWK